MLAALVVQRAALWGASGFGSTTMRNIFDQYEQPENKLTHALFSTLDKDRSLLRPFLIHFGVPCVPPTKDLRITEQRVPGSLEVDCEKADSQGLPDACVFTDDDWAVLFECKVQDRVHVHQLNRHRRTMKRHGFSSSHVVAISVDGTRETTQDGTITVTWRDVYRWFNKRTQESLWANELVRYMRVFEQRMLATDYEIRGTITVFDGLRFDRENPYTYREGKRLLLLLGDELHARKDLHKIGVDPKGDRRPAITGKETSFVWDFLPLRVARGSQQFTAYPHLTMALHTPWAEAAVTVPNGVKGGFRTKLRNLGREGFQELIAELEQRLQPIIKQSLGARPTIYVTQRHYKTQRSTPKEDARLDADLRTMIPGAQAGVKHQPQWLDAAYDLLTGKQSNMQMGVTLRFSYDCPIVRSAKAVDLFADAWKAMAPLISFVLEDNKLS